MPYLTGKEARDNGLLHVVNETVLWPLGISLVANDIDASLRLRVEEMAIVTGLGEREHKAKHRAFEKFKSRRMGTLGGQP